MKHKTTTILASPYASPAVARPFFEAPLPADLPDPLPAQRRRLWDLHVNLHCSIIGTCFSTRELRQVLRRIGCHGLDTSSEHDLHSLGVGLASKPNSGAKVLHKALDRKYGGAIGKFERRDSRESVAALWHECLERGEIPGAYWAVLTHPASDEQLIQRAFGEVHMLSHLVGASNRADILRLKQLESENATLHEKIARQEAHLRESIVERDGTIQELRAQLREAIARQHRSEELHTETAIVSRDATILDLDRRLKRESALRERLEKRLSESLTDLSSQKKRCLLAERQIVDLKHELEIIEGLSLAEKSAGHPLPRDLECRSLLYVGGRSHLVFRLRRLAESAGAGFLHHDGGIEEANDVLTSSVSRSDAIFFPIDCVSHRAVAIIKKICRQMGKPYYPLRSSGLSSFAVALSELSHASSNQVAVKG